MFKDFKFSKRDDEMCERFGLRDGQMRPPGPAFQKNRHWHVEGEDFSFGYGDLSQEDLERIQATLDDHEVFLGWNEHHGSNIQQTDFPMVRVTNQDISFPHREKMLERRRG